MFPIAGRVSWRDAVQGGYTDTRLSQSVNMPPANQTIRARADEIMGVLGAHHLHGIDGVGVSFSRKRGLANWEVFRACVPHQDLTRVCPTEDQVGMEW